MVESYLPKGSNKNAEMRFNKQIIETDSTKWEKIPKENPSIKTNIKNTSSSKKGVRKTTADDVILDEPERLTDRKYQSGKKLYANKHKIFNLNSFIRTVKESWGEDIKGLNNIIKSVSSDSNYENMFNQPEIQKWVVENNKQNLLIPYLSKRLFISKARANRIYNLLPDDSKAKLLKKTQQLESAQVKRASVPISQPISRPKRVSFSRQELNYINMNKHLSPTKITDRLNIIFENNRSQASVLNRIKEFRKQK